MSKGTGILRKKNQKHILALLRKHETSSRLEIAQSLGISKNTVSLIVDQFIKEGLVRETGVKDQKGVGRPRRMISLVADAYKTVGILITEKQIEFTVMDYCANLLEEGKVPLKVSDEADSIDIIIKCCQELLQKFRGVIGIGVGVPGLVDPNKGLVYHSTKLGWDNINLKKVMEIELGINVWIFNNVKVAALGAMEEISQGDHSSTFYIRISEGIGGALIIDNRIFHGGSWTAGEIGHISVNSNGPLCNCGQRGCLEQLIGLSAFKKDVNDRKLDNINVNDMNEIIETIKDPEITGELMKQYGQYLGSAVSQVIHLMNPEVIIIDSPYDHSNLFRKKTVEKAQQDSLTFSFNQTQIKFVKKLFSPAIGAAISVILKFESDQML